MNIHDISDYLVKNGIPLITALGTAGVGVILFFSKCIEFYKAWRHNKLNMWLLEQHKARLEAIKLRYEVDGLRKDKALDRIPYDDVEYEKMVASHLSMSDKWLSKRLHPGRWSLIVGGLGGRLYYISRFYRIAIFVVARGTLLVLTLAVAVVFYLSVIIQLNAIGTPNNHVSIINIVTSAFDSLIGAIVFGYLAISASAKAKRLLADSRSAAQ